MARLADHEAMQAWQFRQSMDTMLERPIGPVSGHIYDKKWIVQEIVLQLPEPRLLEVHGESWENGSNANAVLNAVTKTGHWSHHR